MRWLLLLLFCLAWPCQALEARLTPAGVDLRWDGDVAIILRSTRRLTRAQALSGHFPVARLRGRGGHLLDEAPPEGVTLYYLLDGAPRVVTVPARPLPELQAPRLLVDKANFVLEVHDDGLVVKRYPIALGGAPIKRKLCFDRASTPEGRYHIVGVQPDAAFFKAFDLDYPTAEDRQRYRFAAQHHLLPPGNPAIGGEIQIHGCGIDSNWTWGCIALRDQDMVELFDHPELECGVEVLVTGAQLTLEDLRAIASAPREELRRRRLNDPQALGAYQLKNGLPVTCLPDRRTLRRLGL